MKKTLCYCIGAIAIASLLIVACDKDESETKTTTVIVSAPTLSVSTASVISPADGGEYSFTYTVANPADDGAVSCSADADWITDVDGSTSGSVTFTVSENATGAVRYGTVTVSYTSSNGNAEGAVVVAQNSADAPELTVEPITFTLSADGGTFEFTYSVENASEDGELSCETEATWISDFDYSTEGAVKFTASANDETDIRSGVIVATYTASTGVAQQNVLVAQASASSTGGDDGSSPSISVSDNTLVVEKNAGTYSFDYSVTNPVDGGSVSCSADADWIGDFDYSTDGTVGFSVTKNPEIAALRSATITVVYTYSKGAVAATVAVVQNHAAGFEVEDFVGTYSAYGHNAADGEDQTWTVKIYDDEDGGLIIDGFASSYYDAGYTYPTTSQFVIPGVIHEFDFYVEFPQFTGYGNSSSRTYYWWVQCPKYDSGWYYSVSDGKCSFEYDAEAGTWTGSTGLLYAASSVTSGISSISGLYDGFAPGVVLTKVSDSTDYESDDEGDGETTSSTGSVNRQLDKALTPFTTNFKLAEE